MTARKEKSPEARETVSIRLPPKRVRFFEAKAAEASTYRGTYIADLLLGDEPESWPSVAALGYVIAIHNAVMTSRTITAEQLDELRSILREFARIAREEVLR
ncbi:hypothetical protein J2Y54_002201 [Sphingomonas sp. BE123]|jgi:hypothetical protein|uniref:hypothetical protein n=1 Tax=Sphingomonas sp. BE123 TaxID=2817842 RepID=UPI002865E389|nr:hypothetical protein [Sphingomonas sp. BE123]MDR6852681.1 hypothetical protein [Sphingomonas sp. BE123]